MEDQVTHISKDVSLTFQEILDYQIFKFGKYSLEVNEVIVALIILFFGIIISKFSKRVIYKSTKIDIGRKYAFSQIIHYLIVIFVMVMVLRALGIDVSPILLGSGAILVGIGLGLQNLFLDFISGIIILLDRSIRVGDVIDLDGTIGRVEEIRMRTTTVETREAKHIIFPNSLLTKEKLINFSHNGDEVVFTIEVGVHYDTDIEKAEKLMESAARENKFVLQDKPIFVRLENFGESSLDLKLFYRSNSLFAAPQIRSDIRKEILRKFRQNNINIPYPIRTLEFPNQNIPKF